MRALCVCVSVCMCVVIYIDMLLKLHTKIWKKNDFMEEWHIKVNTFIISWKFCPNIKIKRLIWMKWLMLFENLFKFKNLKKKTWQRKERGQIFFTGNLWKLFVLKMRYFEICRALFLRTMKLETEFLKIRIY